MKKLSIIVVGFVLSLGLSSRSASATQILYYNDFNYGPDAMVSALAATGYTYHQVTTLADFTTGIASGGYVLGILFQQNSIGSTDWDDAFAALETHVSNGGSAIIDDWGDTNVIPFEGTHPHAFGAEYTTNYNDSQFAISAPSLLPGMLNPVSLFNPGGEWGAFSYGLKPINGASCGATFSTSGECAVVFGATGRTIVNGFLADTFPNAGQGQQLYFNEINLLVAQPVPEPASMMLLGTGLAALASRRLRRRKVQ